MSCQGSDGASLFVPLFVKIYYARVHLHFFKLVCVLLLTLLPLCGVDPHAYGSFLLPG